MLRLSALTLLLTPLITPLAYAAKDAGHHGEAESTGLPQFDPSTFSSQVFWLVIAFAVLYIFFSKKTLPEISSVIENRRNHIESDLELAEKTKEEAETVRKDYETSLEDARAQASQAVLDVEAKMKEAAAADADAFRKRAETEIQATEERIVQAKEQAMQEMSTIAAEVAAEATHKIIGVNADAQQAKAIVESLTSKPKAA